MKAAFLPRLCWRSKIPKASSYIYITSYALFA
jgi:hypothetical protein